MKVTVHAKSPPPERMTLATRPLVIWLSRFVELKIEPGDTIRDVAKVIEDNWGLVGLEGRKLAALWFAIGERQTRGKHANGWTEKELNASPKRRYLRG